jgi:hypothetical protein
LPVRIKIFPAKLTEGKIAFSIMNTITVDSSATPCLLTHMGMRSDIDIYAIATNEDNKNTKGNRER